MAAFWGLFYLSSLSRTRVLGLYLKQVGVNVPYCAGGRIYFSQVVVSFMMVQNYSSREQMHRSISGLRVFLEVGATAPQGSMQLSLEFGT
jgi:hypothetical protein